MPPASPDPDTLDPLPRSTSDIADPLTGSLERSTDTTTTGSVTASASGNLVVIWGRSGRREPLGDGLGEEEGRRRWLGDRIAVGIVRRGRSGGGEGSLC